MRKRKAPASSLGRAFKADTQVSTKDNLPGHDQPWEPGQVPCPVCGKPATRRGSTAAPPPVRYDHPFRAFPCVSDKVIVSETELEAFDDGIPFFRLGF